MLFFALLVSAFLPVSRGAGAGAGLEYRAQKGIRFFASDDASRTGWSPGRPDPDRAPDAQALEGQLQAVGPELVLRLSDGRVLQRESLVGLRLLLSGVQVRIDGVEEDASAVGGAILLYRISIMGSGGEPGDFCKPDPRGRRAAFPLPDGAGGFRLTCTSGAEGKCVLLGYRPWDTRSDIPMGDLHRACIHMLRADYGGDDRPATRDGTLIDLYDRFGIQKADMLPDMDFEAAWGAQGAICVAHPRVPEHIGLDDIASRYSRLAGSLGPGTCSEEEMLKNPEALLFNRSRTPQTP